MRPRCARINAPNGAGNVTAEFGRSVLDFANTPGKGAGQMNMSSPGLLGVQTNMWEQGWGYLNTKPHGVIVPPTTDIDIAVSRCAGPGWWGKSWPRNDSSSGTPNGTDWEHLYTYGSWIKSRLEPDCDAL